MAALGTGYLFEPDLFFAFIAWNANAGDKLVTYFDKDAFPFSLAVGDLAAYLADHPDWLMVGETSSSPYLPSLYFNAKYPENILIEDTKFTVTSASPSLQEIYSNWMLKKTGTVCALQFTINYNGSAPIGFGLAISDDKKGQNTLLVDLSPNECAIYGLLGGSDIGWNSNAALLKGTLIFDTVNNYVALYDESINEIVRVNLVGSTVPTATHFNLSVGINTAVPIGSSIDLHLARASMPYLLPVADITEFEIVPFYQNA